MILNYLLALTCLPMYSAIGLDQVGKIRPAGKLPISNSVSNAAETATYTFGFITDHVVPEAGTLELTFPNQFEAGFLVAPVCNLGLCSVSDKKVTINLDFGLKKNTFYELIIDGVKNPPTVGGLGNFALQTFYGPSLLDSNLAFGVAGIENTVGTMLSAAVNVASNEEALAGKITKYEFKFKLNRILGAWNWIRFTLPTSDFYIDEFPTCSAVSINGHLIKGNLHCENTGNTVQLTGISEELQSHTDYAVRLVVTNPQYSMTNSGTFKIETGRNLTNTVYDRRDLIPGVPIKPGNITQISFKPKESWWALAESKIIVYRLRFMLSNPVEEGGSISIIGSSSFNMNGNSIYELESGLDDLSTLLPISMTYNSGTFALRITNFAKYTEPTVISMLLQFTNPVDEGKTTPLVIRSLKADGVTVIDEDLRDAYAEILSYTSPLSVSVSYPGVKTNQATGAFTQIRITFSPQIEIPALGWVEVILPENFSTDSLTAPICTVKPTYMSVAAAKSCLVVGDKLNVQLFDDSTGVYGKFQSGVASYVDLSNIYAPRQSGWSIFDFSTYDNNRNVLESGTAVVNMITNVQTGFAVTTAHAGIDTPTVIMLTWINPQSIPSGVTPEDPYETQGFIEIKFPTMSGASNLFRTDLGLGVTQGSTIPCLHITGISPPAGFDLICTITTLPSAASITSPVIVTVSGFIKITASSNIVIHFPGVKYVQTAVAPTYTITTYQITNRIRADMDTGTVTGVAGSIVPANTASGVTITISNQRVQATSTISLGLPLTTTVATGATLPYLLFQITPTHDLGYCKSSTISCTVDGVARSCVCYHEIDMILITLTATFAAGSHTFSLIGLQNPESVPTTPDNMILYTCGNQGIVQRFTFAGNIPTLIAGVFSDPVIKPSDHGQGYVFIKYTFELKPQHTVPEGGNIQVVFPSSFVLSSSSPKPYCSSMLLDPVDSSEVLCTVTSNTVSLSNFKEVVPGALAYVYVKGVKNPSTASPGAFTFRTRNVAGRIIDQDTSLNTVVLTSAWTVQTITDLIIKPNPSSANATAIYSLEFTPSKFLGSGGKIQIVFPLREFGIIDIPPVCKIDYGVTMFASCTASASTIILTTSSDSRPMKTLISIMNLRNFDEGTSDEFMLTTSYDGVTLQATQTATYFAVTTTQAPSLNMRSLTFYPKNEGELATYQFYFTPQFDIELDDYILITFPNQFDHLLGENFYCWSTGLTGYLECSCVRAYTLKINKHDAYKACSTCQVVLYTYGIKNPNAGETDSIKIGIHGESLYKEFNEFAGSVKTVSAPSYNNLLNTTSDNFYARYTGSYEFNITTMSQIPVTGNGGELWVKFPSDHVLLDSNFRCRSSDFYASGVPNCTLQYDTVRITGQTEIFQGNMAIFIDNIPHPLDEGYAGYIDVEVYDGFNSVILDRSYPNLNPNRFYYEFPGPLIHVNNDKSFAVRRGTYSAFIPITLDYPCGLNLTLVPASSLFNFDPPNIQLDNGEILAYFRVSIPFDTKDSEYVISWTTLGDADPPFYTPILISTFNVTKDESIPVVVEDIMPIPRGGSSFPIKASLSSAPHTDLTVILNIDDAVTGVTLSVETLEFSAGVYELSFTINVETVVEVNNCTILFLISGTNADAYYLPMSSQIFKIFNDDVEIAILAGSVVETTRATATVMFSTNKVCTIYYAYALRGTEKPKLEDVVEQNPGLTTTRTEYGNTRIFDSLNQNVIIAGLMGQTSYSLYVFAVDLLGNSTAEPMVSNFRTKDRYPAAEISFTFDQSYVNDVEIEAAGNKVALYLSLHPWRVLSLQNFEPILESNSQRTITFYIMDKPDSDLYPRPIEMISKLSASKSKLVSSLNNFSPSQRITGSELDIESCSWSTYPYILDSSDWKSISFSAGLAEDGKILSILELSDETSRFPFAFQIYEGTNAKNEPALSIKSKTSGGITVNSTYSSISQNTRYNLHIICVNDYPIFPEVLDNSKMVTIQWTTPKKPAPTPLNINSAVCLILSASYLILF